MKGLLYFVAGALLGSGVTYVVVNRKARQSERELRDYYNHLMDTKEDEIEDDSFELDQEPVVVSRAERSEYVETVQSMNYGTPTSDANLNNGVYVIRPEEFCDDESYGLPVTLNYYEDGYLIDESGTILTDDEIEEMVSHAALTHFGEYEEDSVYVRNDLTKTYYEILMNDELYSETIPSAGPQIDDEE